MPATCSVCGQHSHVPGSKSSVFALALVLFLTLCGFIAAASKLVAPFAIGAIVTFLVYGWRWHTVALKVISAEDMACARKEGHVAALIVFCSWFFR